MSSPKYDYLIFIGRFQPFHIGHAQVIKTALELSKNIVVLVGSSNQPRTIKNPWTFHERVAMIFDGLELDVRDKSRVSCAPLRDRMYNDQKWAAGVQQAVNERLRLDGATNPRIGIIGHNKDESSYYLKMFPQWELVEHEMNEQVSATDLRSLYFEGKNLKFLKALVPAGTYLYLETFSNTKEFSKLIHEYEFINKYKRQWEASPYPPTFVTCDAVVVQSGHVLLIERKSVPGEGLMALPGGFVQQNEFVVDSMVRELREETRLKVPAPVLRGSIKAQRVFDHPNRSLRGRTITHAFLIELPAGELPPVKGNDDARKAMWVPINEVDEEKLFEDHYHIINYFLGRV